jgi:MYXO-CTERM domain-containing protein
MRVPIKFSPQPLWLPAHRLMRCWATAMLAVAMVSVGVAQAGVLEIQITGLDLQYDGTNIFDAGVHNTIGSGNPAESDVLTSMNFYLDGNLVGVQSTNVFADIYISNVLNIPTTGGVVQSLGNGGAFGVDLLSQNIIPGWGLALEIDEMQLFYTGSQIGISVAGFATNLFAQSLPFGLSYDPSQPITIVMSSANLSGVTSAGGFLTGFNSAGTGNVAGIGVPEPSSIVLGAFGLVGLAAYGLRRRKR